MNRALDENAIQQDRLLLDRAVLYLTQAQDPDRFNQAAIRAQWKALCESGLRQLIERQGPQWVTVQEDHGPTLRFRIRVDALGQVGAEQEMF